MVHTCDNSHHDNHTYDNHHEFVRKYVYPVRAINNDVVVNLSVMSTFNKSEINDVRNNRITYVIIFQKSEVSSDGQIQWRYTDKTLRDLDYQELRDKISVPII